MTDQDDYFVIVTGFKGPTVQVWRNGMRTDGNGKPQAHLFLKKLEGWDKLLTIKELEEKFKDEIKALR